MGDDTDAITVTAVLTQMGGTVESSTVTIYLISLQEFDTIILTPLLEDTGINWKLSEDNLSWYDSITLSNVTEEVTPIYAKAIVDNDGSITEDKISCDIRVQGW